MDKVKRFFITAFIGGLVVILPVAVLFKLIFWLVQWMANLVAPITRILVATSNTNQLIAQLLAFILMLTLCFLVGVAVKTAWGSWLHNSLEYWVFSRIPGYRLLKELFAKLQPESEQDFSRPVLVHFDNSKPEFLGFVTDEYATDRYAVFIPTSPSPMNGFVVQVGVENLRFVDASVDTMMKAVLACGVGSREIMESVRRNAGIHSGSE